MQNSRQTLELSFPRSSSTKNKYIFVWKSMLHKQVRRVYHVQTIPAHHNNHEST